MFPSFSVGGITGAAIGGVLGFALDLIARRNPDGKLAQFKSLPGRAR